MDDAALPDPRGRARAWALERLTVEPWAVATTRGALLLLEPPEVDWLAPERAAATHPLAWLLLDAADVRGLPQRIREPLVRHGVYVEHATEGTLEVLVAEAAEALIEGATRRALEARWSVHHAQPLHDPLQRLDALRRGSASLPAGALERVARPLFVQLATALDALTPGDIVAAGEAAGALARLVVVLDEGAHPPTPWLLDVARATHLGPRLNTWLDDLARMVAGDEAAARRVLGSRAGVLRAVSEPLREEFGAPDWLTDPAAFVLRPPR